MKIAELGGEQAETYSVDVVAGVVGSTLPGQTSNQLSFCHTCCLKQEPETMVLLRIFSSRRRLYAGPTPTVKASDST